MDYLHQSLVLLSQEVVGEVEEIPLLVHLVVLAVEEMVEEMILMVVMEQLIQEEVLVVVEIMVLLGQMVALV